MVHYPNKSVQKQHVNYPNKSPNLAVSITWDCPAVKWSAGLKGFATVDCWAKRAEFYNTIYNWFVRKWRRRMSLCSDQGNWKKRNAHMLSSFACTKCLIITWQKDCTLFTNGNQYFGTMLSSSHDPTISKMGINGTQRSVPSKLQVYTKESNTKCSQMVKW